MKCNSYDYALMKQGENSTEIKWICRNFVVVVFYYFTTLSMLLFTTFHKLTFQNLDRIFYKICAVIDVYPHDNKDYKDRSYYNQSISIGFHVLVAICNHHKRILHEWHLKKSGKKVLQHLQICGSYFKFNNVTYNCKTNETTSIIS